MQELADRYYAKLPKGQAIRLDLPAIFRHSHLKVSIPDLSQFDSKLEGDWGPNYQFKTKGKAGLIFQYEDQQAQQLLKHSSYPKKIEFKSPILTRIREKNRWFLEIQDPEYSLNVACYFDHLGFIEKTQLRLADTLGLKNKEENL